MDEDSAGGHTLSADPLCDGPGLAQDHLRPVLTARSDLVRVSVRRHHDSRRDTSALSRPAERLPVVARARRDHAPRALLLRQERDLVPRAAGLEGACELLVLDLEPKTHALVRDLEGDQGSPGDHALKARRGVTDLDVCAGLCHRGEDSGSTARADAVNMGARP